MKQNENMIIIIKLKIKDGEKLHKLHHLEEDRNEYKV